MGEKIDPVAVGARVKERREELGWGQARLGKEAGGYSQTNIGWIESGEAKDPRKQVIRLAEALRTTVDWLLYNRGPRDAGPPVMTKEEYEALPLEIKETLTALADKRLGRRPARDRTADL